MSDEEEGDFVARSTDGATSWIAARKAKDSKLNTIFKAQLEWAGVRGMTTNEMSRRTGIDRDSFSPRPSQFPNSVEYIGKRLEKNKAGNLRPFNIYRLKKFSPARMPLLMGWQVLEKDHTDGHSDVTIPSRDQNPVGVGLNESGLAEGVPPEVPISHA